MDDEELLRRFEAGTLDALPHQDHVRVGYLLSRRYPLEEATEHVSAGLRGLARRFGMSPSFLHVTRTVAWMRIIAGTPGDGSSFEFLDANPQLRRRDLLSDYYSVVRLNNPIAHRRFVGPNKQEFPTERTG